MNSDDLLKFLRSLRDDLLDRRLLPLVALVGVALIAAVAYAVTSGGSSPSTPPPTASAPSSKGGLPVSEAGTSAAQAVAETTSGLLDQRQGGSRNPFTPLVGATQPAAAAKAPSSAPTASTVSSGSGTAAKGESATPTTPTPTTPTKKKINIRFTVAAEFGVVPPAPEGGAAPPPLLTKYTSLKLDEPLPANNPQLVYLGVVLKTGKDAVFALTGEAILHGTGVCLPSTTHCQAVQLQAGQSETAETLDAAGKPVTYLLKLVSITKTVTASSASVHPPAKAVSQAGTRLLSNAGLLPIDGLRSSASSDVLAAVRG